MKKRSKRYKKIEIKKVKEKLSIEKSLEMIKGTCTSKIDESIDLSIRINTKQSKGGDYNLRTTVKLPNGNGKKNIIAVLCEPEKVQEAKNLGRIFQVLKIYWTQLVRVNLILTNLYVLLE